MAGLAGRGSVVAAGAAAVELVAASAAEHAELRALRGFPILAPHR